MKSLHIQNKIALLLLHILIYQIKYEEKSKSEMKEVENICEFMSGWGNITGRMNRLRYGA